jgi:hypothetical protein
MAAEKKKRGMSLEDKRNTLLDIFHEGKDVLTLKVIGTSWRSIRG